MTAGNTREQVFQRLLAQEAGTKTDARAVATAARRLCERFALHVTPLIGDAGIAAICARSLDLTQRQFPFVAPLCTSDQRDAPFTRLQASLEQLEPALAVKVAVAVIVTTGDLLASLIGETLTASLLRETWPGDFDDNHDQETS